jgi:predicted porin
MMFRKTQVASAVGALFLAGTAAYAQQPPQAATVQLYGQVSRTLLFADDGVQSKWFHTDNESSGTRLGVQGSGQVMPGLRAGFKIEFDFQSNESQRVNFGPAGPISNFPAHDEDVGGFAERHADAYLEGAWGRLSIGQGDGAANGASESDLSGTGMANGIGVADLGGGFAHRTGTAFGPSVGATINQQDFESRYDRLMYTTPSFSGFRAQVSHGQSGNADVKEASLWYGGKLGGFGEIAAAVGWSEQGGIGGTRDDETIGASISWLHTSGINLTASWTQRDNPTALATPERESEFMYFKVGYKFGRHAIAVDYAQGEDFVLGGDEAKMYGIGYVWNPIRWLELYAGYKIHELDRSVGSFDDVKIGHLGTRVRF